MGLIELVIAIGLLVLAVILVFRTVVGILTIAVDIFADEATERYYAEEAEYKRMKERQENDTNE